MRLILSTGGSYCSIFGLNEKTKPSMMNGDKENKVEEWEEEFFGKEEAREYRGLAARFHFMSLDWPELQFAIKQCSRDMSNRKVVSWRSLKKVA
eukprot:1816796-Karenia_brevis.AAC.2